ncbi:MAG: phosphoenolpyruvate carboxykinase (GTP), partial [Planctomycetota bacterium]
MSDAKKLLKEKLTAEHYDRLIALDNPKMYRFVADSIKLCNPDSIFVMTDSDEDIAYIRDMAVQSGEERPLKTAGHTYHFDGMQDQGRDRQATKYLVPKTDSLSKALNQIDREKGLA